jgi:hypothetical protein
MASARISIYPEHGRSWQAFGVTFSRRPWRAITTVQVTGRVKPIGWVQPGGLGTVG